MPAPLTRIFVCSFALYATLTTATLSEAAVADVAIARATTTIPVTLRIAQICARRLAVKHRFVERLTLDCDHLDVSRRRDEGAVVGAVVLAVDVEQVVRQ